MKSNEVLPIDIIIPVSGKYSIVKKTIESLINYTNYPYNLIIVDNGISEPEINSYLIQLKSNNPNIQLVAKSTPTGFSASVNKGIEISKSKVIAIVDSGTIVSKNWLPKLLRAFNTNTVGIVSPRCNNKIIPQLDIRFNLSKDIPSQLQEMNQYFETIKIPEFTPSPFALASCMVIKRDVIEVCGGFDSIYSEYSNFADLDICLRAAKKGFTVTISNITPIYNSNNPDPRKIAVNYSIFSKKWKKHPSFNYLKRDLFPETKPEFFKKDKDGFYFNEKLIKEHKNYLLINPSIVDTLHFNGHLRKVVPSGLLRVASYLMNQGNKVNYFDFEPYGPEHKPIKADFITTQEMYVMGKSNEEFINYIKDLKNIDEVYITLTLTFHYPNSHLQNLISIIRSVYNDIKVTFGGVYATLCPEELKELDATIHIGPYHTADSLRPLLEISREEEHAVMRIVKGCPRTCSYCVVPSLEGRLLSHLDKENIVKQFQEYYALGFKNFVFWDSNLLFGKENLYLLMDYMDNYGYIDSISLDFSYGLEFALIDDDFTKRLGKFKLRNNICVPLESSEYEIFKEKFLRPYTHLGFITKAVKKLQEAHYEYMNFYVMCGLPYQTIEQILKTLIFGWRLGLFPIIMQYTPIPQTEDYKRYLSFYEDKEYWQLNPSLYPCASGELTVDVLKIFSAFTNTRLRYSEEEGYYIAVPTYDIGAKDIKTNIDYKKVFFKDQNIVMEKLKELVYMEEIKPEELDERTFRVLHNLTLRT